MLRVPEMRVPELKNSPDTYRGDRMAMVPCKECKKLISNKAQACPNCGAVPKKPMGCMGIVGLIIGFPILLTVVTIIAKVDSQNDEPVAGPSAPTVTQIKGEDPAQRAALQKMQRESIARQKKAADDERARQEAEANKPIVKLVNFTCDKDSSGNSIVHGTVKNISGEPIRRRINVHASFYTASGDKLGSDSGYVDYEPILAGQEAPFKFYGPTNPLYRKCTIDAMTVGFGTQVPWKR